MDLTSRTGNRYYLDHEQVGEAIQGYVQDLTNAITDLENEKEVLEKRVSELENNNEELKDVIKELENRNLEMAEHISELEGEEA